MLKDLEGFLRRMASDQEEVGSVVASALNGDASSGSSLAVAVQHFDRTRQNLEAVAEVIHGLSVGREPSCVTSVVNLEELRSWLDGDRSRDRGRSGEADLF